VLLSPAWLDAAQFQGLERIETDAQEPYAANALLAGETVLVQPAFPRTRERLEKAGVRTTLCDQSELAKAEGALTCCSILFED
jgi:dimethylargininase